ncbi:MAG: hypothetical protein IH985_00110 [Planctomycetes bacterium]|nr:hypothetical protein [Planctomycetota bacterium]
MRLGVGLVASLLLHAGAAMTWLSPTTPGSDALAADPTINQSTIRLGIERSPHRTIAWLGFIDPSEHLAPDREVEQSALSPLPPAALVADPAAARSEAVARLLNELAARAGPALDRWYEPRREALIAILQAAAGALQAQAAESEPAEPVVAQAPPVTPAIESPKEADASAKDEPLEYRNGRVAAGEGLDITTVRPRWALSTRITASPGNPVVIVEFARDGRVRSAVFEGLGSGFESVDGPLLDAIYAWRARGERLEALPQDDPDAVLTVRIRVHLR